MKLTRKQKDAIRAHWPWYNLRFKADGTVEAKRKTGSSWGLLHTPSMTEGHLRHIGAIKQGD
jgi:hypothetical protein